MHGHTMEEWFVRLSSGLSTRPTLCVDVSTESSDFPASSIDSGQAKSIAGTLSEDFQQLAKSWLNWNGSMQSVSRMAMACEFEILLNEHQYRHGVEQSMVALKQIERVESLLSVYRAQSQFSKINQFAGRRAVAVDALTLELLELAQDVSRWTGGCFDITAGALSEVWGFSRRAGAMPAESQIAESLSTVGFEYVVIDSDQSTVKFKRPGVRINPGGIGKGYALDLAAKSLSGAGIGDFMIHGGLSSIIARGHRQGLNRDWTVALKHPWRTEELLETLPLRNQALGTSGSGKQFFHFGGKRYSHLIDPRTGWPAQGMMSVTVVCPSGAVADALATGMFIMGVPAAIEFCDAHPSIAAILIYQDAKSGAQRIEHRNWRQVVED